MIYSNIVFHLLSFVYFVDVFVIQVVVNLGSHIWLFDLRFRYNLCGLSDDEGT